jgi:hypothetical protein
MSRTFKPHHQNKPHGHQQQTRDQQTAPQQPAETPAMTFEVDQPNNDGQRDQGDQSNQATAVSITPSDILLALRAKQAALDVVLDNVTLMRAQSRLMGILDQREWAQAFLITKQEVERLRIVLTEGASFEELVYAAEDAGEDIQALAERLGVTVEVIADALDNRNSNTVKI